MYIYSAARLKPRAECTKVSVRKYSLYIYTLHYVYIARAKPRAAQKGECAQVFSQFCMDIKDIKNVVYL